MALTFKMLLRLLGHFKATLVPDFIDLLSELFDCFSLRITTALDTLRPIWKGHVLKTLLKLLNL